VPLNFGLPADFTVEGISQARFEDVLALQTTLAQKFSKGDGQLVINHEFHDAESTTRSV
jgi:hypothetical protein